MTGTKKSANFWNKGYIPPLKKKKGDGRLGKFATDTRLVNEENGDRFEGHRKET